MEHGTVALEGVQGACGWAPTLTHASTHAHTTRHTLHARPSRACAQGAKAYEKAEDPIWALDHNLAIDCQHYLEHHLSQPLIRIFEPVMKNPKELLTGEGGGAGNWKGGGGIGVCGALVWGAEASSYTPAPTSTACSSHTHIHSHTNTRTHMHTHTHVHTHSHTHTQGTTRAPSRCPRPQGAAAS